MKILEKAKQFLSNGHPRSVKAKKNVLMGFAVKGVSILVQLLYVPLLVGYLGPSDYGIFLTLTSIVGWFGFFNLGLTFGLKNRFAEALARDEHELARVYVSTTYAILGLVFVVIFAIFALIYPFINVQKLFNLNVENIEITWLLLQTFAAFCLRLVLQVVFAVLEGDQRPAYVSYINMVSSVISLVSIYILTRFSDESSLFVTGSIINIVPLISIFIYSLVLFSGRYKAYRPNIKSIDFGQSGLLFSLGLKFFFIQIADMILFSTTNFLIIQLYTSEDVTKYNIVYKYFSIVTMVFGIIIAPLWSASTEAYIRNDIDWIKRTFAKLNKIGLIFAGVSFIMLLLADPIIKFWVRKDLNIPFSLEFMVFVTIVSYVFFVPYVSFLNGVGKIRLNLNLTILNALMFVPFVFLYCKVLDFGVAGIVLAFISAELPCRITQPIQYFKLVNKTASGIWNS